MKKNTLYKNLELLKNELFDSPDEIKGAFNVLVAYFDSDYTSDVLKRQIAQITKESQKIYEQIQNSKSETEKQSLRKKLEELEKKANKLDEDLKKRKALLNRMERDDPRNSETYKNFEDQEYFSYGDKGKSNEKSYYVCAEVKGRYRGKTGSMEDFQDWEDRFISAPSSHEAEQYHREDLEEKGYKILRIKAFPCEWQTSSKGKRSPKYDAEAIRKWERSGK